MGYCMEMVDARFCITKNNVAPAQQAIAELYNQQKTHPNAYSGSSNRRHFSWMNDKDFGKNVTLTEQLKAWRWLPTIDNEGNVGIKDFLGEKIGDDMVLWEAIAPFVESGSYIQMRGEDHAQWTWQFISGKVIET